MSIAFFLSALAMQIATAPPCPKGQATCEPWDREWETTKLLPGDVVTSDGRIIPPTSLAGLRLGQSLADAQNVYALAEAEEIEGSNSRRMVKVNMTFEEPYEIYNLISDQQRIVGNASFCRNKLVGVIVSLDSAADYFQAVKRFVQSHGQPVIGFDMVSSEDDSKNSEDITASWPGSALSVRYPMAPEGKKGAIALTKNEACR